jgi:hypothetical protein
VYLGLSYRLGGAGTAPGERGGRRGAGGGGRDVPGG